MPRIKNFRILQMNRRVSAGQQYFDPDSQLNCEVMEMAGDVALIKLFLDTVTPVGYDVCICRDSKLPKTEDWGALAWSWKTYNAAKKQFDGLKEEK